MTRFYSDTELKELGFKSLGDNVTLARNCTIDDPSKISIGNHVRIDDFCILTGTIEIGDWTHIAHYVHLSGHAGIFIGDHCGIGSRTTIYTSVDDLNGESLVGPTYPDKVRLLYKNKIVIKRLVAMGINCIVFPGSQRNPTYISEGAVFHAGSLIYGRFFSMAIFGSKHIGSAAEFIRDRKDNVLLLAKQIETAYNEVYITVEVSSNWQGDLNILTEMAKQCKAAGVNAIKLQAFRKDQMTKRYDRINSSVTFHNIAEIDKIMSKVGIEWYCTPCYVEAVKFINPYVNLWKIRAKDCDNKQLIDKVLATGKKLIMSCESPKRFDTGRIKTLYTINKHPTPEEDIDWSLMKQFDGFSCHTPLDSVLYRAVNGGIKYLEFHITPDKGTDLVDNIVSFGIQKLPELVANIREIEHETKQSYRRIKNVLSRL